MANLVKNMVCMLRSMFMSRRQRTGAREVTVWKTGKEIFQKAVRKFICIITVYRGPKSDIRFWLETLRCFT